MRCRVLSCLMLLVTLQCVSAQMEMFSASPTTHAELVSEALAIAPGATITVAVELTHPPGWHSYYQNSGGVETPLTLHWGLPAGVSAGPIQWPVPTVVDGLFGKSFVYSGNPVFLIDLTAPTTLPVGGTITLTVDAAWQICEDRCLNEQQSLNLTLPVRATVEPDPAQIPWFTKARAHQPSQPVGWQITAHSDGADIDVRVESSNPQDAAPSDFIPDQPFVRAASAGGSIRSDGHAWLIHLQRATHDALDHPLPQGTALSGILIGPQPMVLPTTVITQPPPQSQGMSTFLHTLAAMMLGGMLLNLMPCVFPVIGLKILGFVEQAGSDRKKIAGHGLIFTLGVMTTFGVLSGTLYAARTAAGSPGWGYQLQNPWVIMTLMVLMFALALNLFGLFEIGTSATSLGGSLHAKQGFTGSFCSGALATVVATPCSAPWLGAALGATIGLPGPQFFAAFGAMALGLALPYLLLSIFPQLLGFLPRPGVWMESFKQATSFLLFATAGYLLWVYTGQIGLDNMLDPILGLSAIAVAAWIYGRWHLPQRTRATRIRALALSAVFGVGGLLLAKPPTPSSMPWEPWSAARVTTLLDQGTPVYIDFTAQWCATCQVNKKRAYTPEVVARMKAKRVVALKADKTVANPEIEAALRKLGRTAIPVNVLLAPGKPPIILPELLAPSDLLDALRQL